MEASFEYQHPYSVAGLTIVSPNNINNDTNFSSSSLPLLAVHFQLRTDEQYWSTPSVVHHQTHIKSLRDLKIHPSIYMVYDTFYHFMQFHLENWGQEFDRNYRHLVIRDMISTVHELVEDESNKGRQNLKVYVNVSLAIDHFLDERDLLEESTSRFNDGMVPASKSSIMGLPERMENDEDHQCTDDDCVICFEEFGKERKILRMPCLHMFHGECITTWLEKSHCCPICRYEMPTTDELGS
ncbi:E3 ubiquitin ligase BIG BROTHER-related-like [Lycium ferocissimum]|uniref:E3 ubiquitin ligase BIG BROTHER-related-like n=1 Tax=Lycium ferocissimum TaxID=112874 RepID=UPI00281589F5|nr:E3 ubiquitin ligase BIG BROTHER-related-like [Lycium ferocissimum]